MGEVGGAARAELGGQAASEPLSQALRGGVIDGEGADLALWDDITSVTECDLVVALGALDGEVGVFGREEEGVVQLLAEGGDDPSQLYEVEQPGVSR